MPEVIDSFICICALVTYRVGALFSFFVGFLRRTRAAADGSLDVGGKVMTAGFPDPRGGPRSGAPATSARSCSSDFREVTEEVARLAWWNFRAPGVSGGGALIGREKKSDSR